jgi:hypothetical protein
MWRTLDDHRPRRVRVLLHHHRRVFMRRAVNDDYAGALPGRRRLGHVIGGPGRGEPNSFDQSLWRRLAFPVSQAAGAGA